MFELFISTPIKISPATGDVPPVILRFPSVVDIVAPLLTNAFLSAVRSIFPVVEMSELTVKNPESTIRLPVPIPVGAVSYTHLTLPTIYSV